MMDAAVTPSTRPGGLSADEIARLLPHRYPFFLLDRVTSVEPGDAVRVLLLD